MGRRLDTIGRLLLDELVGAVALDLEDREGDSSLHVSVLVETEGLGEDRGLDADLADLTPYFDAADPAVLARVRDAHRDHLDRDEGRRSERDRLAVTRLELRDERLRQRFLIDVGAESRDIC